jgi:hypothetical protein
MPPRNDDDQELQPLNSGADNFEQDDSGEEARVQEIDAPTFEAQSKSDLDKHYKAEDKVIFSQRNDLIELALQQAEKKNDSELIRKIARCIDATDLAYSNAQKSDLATRLVSSPYVKLPEQAFRDKKRYQVTKEGLFDKNLYEASLKSMLDKSSNKYDALHTAIKNAGRDEGKLNICIERIEAAKKDNQLETSQEISLALFAESQKKNSLVKLVSHPSKKIVRMRS